VRHKAVLISMARASLDWRRPDRVQRCSGSAVMTARLGLAQQGEGKAAAHRRLELNGAGGGACGARSGRCGAWGSGSDKHREPVTEKRRCGGDAPTTGVETQECGHRNGDSAEERRRYASKGIQKCPWEAAGVTAWAEFRRGNGLGGLDKRCRPVLFVLTRVATGGRHHVQPIGAWHAATQRMTGGPHVPA
jgi:hypothetical protein